jgi:hypothetical protein
MAPKEGARLVEAMQVCSTPYGIRGNGTYTYELPFIGQIFVLNALRHQR